MKDLLLKHYNLIKQRNLITPKTNVDDFMWKLEVEFNEVKNAHLDDVWAARSPSNEFNQELIDLVMVAFHYFQHYGVDFRDELNKNILIQENRVKSK